MVAPKRGRGAKAQAAAKAKPAEEPAQEDVTEAPEAMEDNGQAEGAEQGGQAEAAAEGADNAEGSKDGDGELKPDEKKEEKVESGKLLVENLPSSYLFDYQEKLKELFSKHGEVASVKRGPIIVTELTTTPTLSAIVEFKNKDSLEKALAEEGTVLDGSAITVAVESRADTAVLVGVPYEASTDYVRLLFAQCGEVAHIHEFSKTKYKILRVTFHEKEAVEKALKLDRELRINGFMVTVSKYRDEDEQKQHTQHVNKVQQEMRKSRSGTFPVYFTSEIIRDIEAKAEYHRLWKRQRDDATYETFKMLRAKVKAAIDEARSNYEKQHSTNDEAAEPAADNPDTQFATDSYDTQFSIDNYAQFSGDGHDSQFAMDSFEGQLFSGSQNKRQHPQNQNRNQPNVNANANANSTPPNRANNFPRPRGAAAFNARGNFRGARGRGGFGGRGGAFPRGGFAPVNAYMPPQAFMGRPQGGFMNDGQRPNKRLRM